jgi:hypothetical protein
VDFRLAYELKTNFIKKLWLEKRFGNTTENNETKARGLCFCVINSIEGIDLNAIVMFSRKKKQLLLFLKELAES